MAPASPSLLSGSSRLKWKKRKRESNLGGRKQQKLSHDDEDEEEDEDEDPNAAQPADDDPDPTPDPVPGLRQSEVLADGGQRISDFPPAVRRSVNRPHRSVLAIVAAERSADGQLRTSIENISHGQLQVLSAVLPDHPALTDLADPEKPPAYVCTPPPLIEGKGVVKNMGGNRVLVLPMHSDWFDHTTVHRLERQVVPHFFSGGKTKMHTPERYVALRNSVVAKYMEDPGKRLSFGECQALVPGVDLYDLNRIVRFLDHWGIINFLAGSENSEPRGSTSLIREEANGELQLVTGPLKSIDSLVQFDRPRSSYRPDDVLSLSLVASKSDFAESADLDSTIRERLSEHSCSHCSTPLPRVHYQSQKEMDTALCSHCFHDGKFVIGHSSLDFAKVDTRNICYDLEGVDNWTDQETFLLLEGLEKYHDNWNEIADHVGTKSKAQCILHFVRLPMEDGLLDNFDFPPSLLDMSNCKTDATIDGSSNGYHEGTRQDESSENRLPFSSATNPVMALVAFLATSVGPRVAATCANAALTVLTKDDGKQDLANVAETDSAVHHASSDHGHKAENQGLNGKTAAAGSLSTESVKLAAVFGLSAAAMKAKLFADQEEREIQRLSATIVNYQLKRLELKLKQFAEIETLLLKECEQVERSRQSILAERARMLSARFVQSGAGPAGAAVMAAGSPQMSVSLPTAAPAASTMINSNTRQADMQLKGQSVGVGAQANLPSMFGNNMPTHPHMPFISRQPMFPFVGPRLPLSAIHPPQATNVMVPSGISSSSSTNQHPLLRSMSGNNSMS